MAERGDDEPVAVASVNAPRPRRRERRQAERVRRKRGRRALAAGAAAATVAAIVTPAEAATFTVSNLYDAGAGSLRQAVADANAAAGPDVIDFQAGLTGGIVLSSGQLAITDSVDIQGPGSADLAVSGNDGSRVFYLYSNAAVLDVTISGLTVTQGSAGSGAGIINFNEIVTLDDVNLTGNNASGDGGGLWSTGGSLTILNSTISGNTAGTDGGGIYVESTAGPVLIQNTQITGNGAADDGGGVYFYSPGEVTIDRSTISGNTAAFLGGGIYLYDTGGPLTIRDTTISGNTAGAGGGIAAYRLDAEVRIENSTISGNQATYANGGGIYLYSVCGDCSGSLTIAHSTIAGNTAAGGGGGIYTYYGTVALDHTIVGDNTATVDNDLCGDGEYDASFSLIEDPGLAIINDNGGNIFNQDPQLGPLTNNGGPTETHLAALTSPVINAGDPAFTPPPSNDQRGTGFPRVVNGQIDIGAVERAAAVAGTLQFTLSGYVVNEGGGTATITVTRVGGTDGAVSVGFATSNGTATQPADYLPGAGTLNWADGDAVPKSFQVTIVDDPDVEPPPDETVNLTLSNAMGGATLGSPSTATLAIVDNDIAAAPSVVEVPTLDEWARLLLAGLLGAGGVLALRRRRDLAGPTLALTLTVGAAAAWAEASEHGHGTKAPAHHQPRARQEAVSVEQKAGRMLAHLPDGSTVDLATVEVKVKDHRPPRARQAKALPADLGALLAEPGTRVRVRPARQGRPAKVVIVVGASERRPGDDGRARQGAKPGSG